MSNRVNVLEAFGRELSENILFDFGALPVWNMLLIYQVSITAVSVPSVVTRFAIIS